MTIMISIILAISLFNFLLLASTMRNFKILTGEQETMSKEMITISNSILRLINQVKSGNSDLQNELKSINNRVGKLTTTTKAVKTSKKKK